MDNFKYKLLNFIKVNTGLWAIFIGLILSIIPYLFDIFKLIQYVGEIRIESFNILGQIFNVVGASGITVGLTIIIVDVLFEKYKEKDKDYKKVGIMNVFEDRLEMQKLYPYKDIISKFNHIVFVGTKHSDFVENITKNKNGIRNLILKKNEKFTIDIYFLNPNSEYKYLFEEDEKLPDKADLGETIIQIIKSLLKELNQYPDLKKRINIYLHNTIPIGNVSIFDDYIYLVNRYLFFEESPKTMWYELNRDGALNQRIIAFYERMKSDQVRAIYSFSDLKPLEDKELKELITVLDHHGNPTNFNRAREIVHRRGYLHKSVHVWIVNKQGEVLLQKRSSNVEVSKNLWGCSCTGHVKTGQNSIETVRDEILEELGVDINSISNKNVVKINSLRHHYEDDDNLYHDNEINDVYLVEIDKEISDYIINSEVVDEIKYMPLSDFIDDYNSNNDQYVNSHLEEYKFIFRYLKEKYYSK